MRSFCAAACSAALLLASVFSDSAFAIETYDDYTNRAATLASLSANDGQFGEQLSDYNGAMSFAVTDVALPGNSSLPVAFGRTHRVGSDLPIAPGLLGQWDIDLPYLHGIFAGDVGWQVSTAAQWNRCSSVGTAAAMKPQPVSGSFSGTSDDDFDGEEFWSGNRIRLPGGGDESLLLASTPLSARPQGSSDYRWVTTGNWYFRCLSTLKNGIGEGFLAVAPDGTRYYFDWMIGRTALGLEKPFRLGPNVQYSYMPRQKVMIYPSRVEDRFGNWVNYQWSGTQLLSIQASDGRLLNLNYVTAGAGASAGARVSTVTDGVRTWNYAYDSIGNLTTVTLPDASKWTLNMPAASINYGLPSQTGNDGCTRYSTVQPVRYTYTMTQPSGLTAEYTFAPRIHSRSRVWPKCSWDDDKFQDRNKGPGRYYHALSLVNKKIYGPGVSTRSWDFKYWSGQQGGSWYDCSICSTSKTTEITDSAGTFTRYTFSNHYGVSEGRLLKVELGADINTLSTIETYQYDTPNDTAFPVYIRQYGAPGTYRAADAMEGMVVPLRAVTKIREGTAFSSTIESFDVFARPIRIAKVSGLGDVKTDEVDYYHDLQAWVLGQVLRERNIDTGATVSETQFNAQALPWRTYTFGKLQQTLSYWPDGTVNTVTDGRNNTTWLGDYYRGIPRLIAHPATAESPAGTTESAVVDSRGWITSVTNEIGSKTCYSYDTMGRLASTTYPSETQLGVCDTSRWNQTTIATEFITTPEHGIPAGHWRTSTGTGTGYLNVYYDAMLRPVLEESLDLNNIAGTLSQVVKRYDSSGRLSFQSYPTNNVDNAWDVTQGVRTFYDVLDRTVRIEQDSDNSTVLATTTEYLPGLEVRTTNPRNLQTTTRFMAWDQPGYELPILSQQPEGKTVQIGRHPQFGWPLALTQRNAANTLSQTRRYVYDSNAQLCKTIEPETGATVTGYDAAGNPAWSAAGLGGDDYANPLNCSTVAASASGRVVSRNYDARNRLTALYFPDGRGDQAWTYTPDGLTATITTYNAPNNGAPVVNAYHYNHRRLVSGHAESVSQPNWYGWGIGYGYDANAHLSVQTYPTGVIVDYAPNGVGQATKAGSYASGAQYYPNGALKQFTYGNGIVHTMTQNARQLPQRVSSSGGVLDFGYLYDANGNPTHIANELVAGYDTNDRWMTYDGLDRLTDAGSASFGGDHWHRFTYDALDNMTSWKLAGVKDYAEYVYDANRLTSIRNTAGATVVLLDYDAQGNLNNKNSQAYVFDYGNRLREVPGKESYRYDGLGRRVMSSRPTSHSLFQYSQSGQLLYEEHSDRPNGVHVYLAGSLIATRHGDGMVTYQHTDALGSPVAVTNAQGQVIERNDYEPYGAIIGKPTRSGIGYTGHMMDGATGLTYMQQRYYDQSIGRFLSVDPVAARTNQPNNFNRYWYANGNPYKFVDPDGRDGFYFADIDVIVIPVHFTGKSATPENVALIKSRVDSLRPDGGGIQVVLQILESPGGIGTNIMDLSPGYWNMGDAGEGVWGSGGNTGHINSGNKGWVSAAAHDIMHFVGAPDGYVDTGGKNENRTMRIKEGYTTKHIMADRSGNKLSHQDISSIKANESTQTLRASSFRDRYSGEGKRAQEDKRR